MRRILVMCTSFVVNKKKTKEKYVKKYKKIFTKKNAGKKVKVSL